MERELQVNIAAMARAGAKVVLAASLRAARAQPIAQASGRLPVKQWGKYKIRAAGDHACYPVCLTVRRRFP
jgi:hypothetical protein